MREFNIEYNGKTYTCCITRQVMKKLELQEGFTLGETKPISMVYTLFYGSLMTKHPFIKRRDAEKMLDDLTVPDENGEVEYDLVEIYEELIAMTKDCYDTQENVKAKKSIKSSI